MSVCSLVCQQSVFLAMSQWQTFLRVLPTRWRRKPSGTENTSLSPYIEIEILIPPQHHQYSVLAAVASRRKADTMQCVRASCIRARLACDSAVPDRLLVYLTAARHRVIDTVRLACLRISTAYSRNEFSVTYCCYYYYY